MTGCYFVLLFFFCTFYNENGYMFYMNKIIDIYAIKKPSLIIYERLFFFYFVTKGKEKRKIKFLLLIYLRVVARRLY